MGRYLVAGVGIAGAASIKALTARGHHVHIYNAETNDTLNELAALAVDTHTGNELPDSVWKDVDEVIVSPGIPPHHWLTRKANALGLDTYSEPELAWRLRPANAAAWLAVTGTNGKTSTVTMLASILNAAGLRTAALGNIGLPLVDAIDNDVDVLAVELSSQQLHWSRTLSPDVGAILNLADDHLSWHGGFDEYAHAKTAIWRGPTHVAGIDDPRVRVLAREHGPHLAFTMNPQGPEPGQIGIQGSHLVDNTDATSIELAVADTQNPAMRTTIMNMLAAASLARAHGVRPEHIASGLAQWKPEPHRNTTVGVTPDGITFIDDSKGTNPHATMAALSGHDRVVWIAGGQLKGVDIDALVKESAHRFVGVVLLGEDRHRISESLARHAPDVPVRIVDQTDHEAMNEVVSQAMTLARQPGDTVLLSPAAASYDMYTGYQERGQQFAAAVRRCNPKLT